MDSRKSERRKGFKVIHPTRRFLFSVKVDAHGTLVYSVAAPDEVTACESLKAGDQNCALIYEDINVQPTNPPAIPVCLGLDTRYRVQRNS